MVEWRKWPSIHWDEAKCSPYVHYWSGGSVDFVTQNHSGAFNTQRQMRTCPAVKWNPSIENFPVTYSTIRPVGVTETFYPLSKIRRPSRFMLMVESTRATSSSGYSISSGGDFTSRVRPLTVQGADNRHDGSVNALMADYSVKEMKWREIQAGLNFWNTF
jgi:prepilin-type processing-associated H-X9-DG protein